LSSSRLIYVDASALLKLVVDEPESAVLRSSLEGEAMVISALGTVEVRRAVRRTGRDQALARAEQVLTHVELVALSDEVLDRAAMLEPAVLRTLDAIHVATAIELGDQVAEVVTYDRRMVDAARLAGLSTSSPA